MLNTYDLYDLYAVFVGIRFHPEHCLNGTIMDRIVCALNDRESCEINQIRKAVRDSGIQLNDDIYSFAITENVYSYIPFILKNETVYTVLLSSCEEMKKVIMEGNREQITDLADCLHNLPLLITESKGNIPKNFWKNEVAYYRKKWNKQFLAESQKQYRC